MRTRSRVRNHKRGQRRTISQQKKDDRLRAAPATQLPNHGNIVVSPTSSSHIQVSVQHSDPGKQNIILERYEVRGNAEHLVLLVKRIQGILHEQHNLVKNIDIKSLTKDAAAGSMLSTIEEELRPSGFPELLAEQNASRDSVLAESFRRRQLLLADSYTAPEVSKLLGTSRQTPLNRAEKGDLLAVYENGKHLFPIWQFDPAAPNRVIPGFSQVLQALKISPIEKLYWLCHMSPYLEKRTPIQALKDGDVERVVSIARGVGE